MSKQIIKDSIDVIAPRFTPVVDDHVTSVSARVFNDRVIELNDMGFICERSGQWEGTLNDWKISDTKSKTVSQQSLKNKAKKNAKKK